jgi:DNA end-binding protein Ku
MARSMWSGSISFGLVQIPVGLYTAENREEGIRLTLLDSNDMSPVGYRHINKNTGEEVPKERRVKGYEVAKDEYVILTDEDFKRANVKATETIDIHSFVDAGDIPITRFEKPYYMAPPKKGTKAYALLLQALHRTGKVGLATFVMRQRQHLCAVVPMDDVLVLEILRYDYEIADPAEQGVAPELESVKLSSAEIEMAERLIEGMAAPFSTVELRDTYHDDLLALIEERRDHPEHIPTPLPKEKKPSGKVVDIMSLLKKSVEERATGHGGAAADKRAKPERKRAARTKTTRARTSGEGGATPQRTATSATSTRGSRASGRARSGRRARA